MHEHMENSRDLPVATCLFLPANQAQVWTPTVAHLPHTQSHNQLLLRARRCRSRSRSCHGETLPRKQSGLGWLSGCRERIHPRNTPCNALHSESLASILEFDLEFFLQ